MEKVEFFFDCSSPWTYIAFHNILALREELGMIIEWRPILVGGVFNAINTNVYRFRDNPVPAKEAYLGKDLADWARLSGLRILWQPSIFPVNSVRAMRACIVALDQERLEPFALRLFELYWVEDQDISQDGALLEAASCADVNGDLILNEIEDVAIKDRLRKNTEELIHRGGFGSPTMFVGKDDMYFGNDRLGLVKNALLTRS
jgi:2-hydroxychromene-2-carboxylate isomerase